MKTVVTTLLLLLVWGTVTSQIKVDTAFTLTLQMPKSLKQGAHTNLKAKIKNRSAHEFSGRAVLEILDSESGKPIDGWFQNIFPQQYFTIEAGKSAIVYFDIHVPYTVKKPVRCRVIAQVGQKNRVNEAIISIVQ